MITVVFHYIQSNIQSMVIPNYNENYVTLAINSLNNSTPGWDNIPTLIAKQVINCYTEPRVYLIILRVYFQMS